MQGYIHEKKILYLLQSLILMGVINGCRRTLEYEWSERLEGLDTVKNTPQFNYKGGGQSLEI